LTALFFLLSGCSLFGGDEQASVQQIDPPPADIENLDPVSQSAEGVEEEPETAKVALYFKDPDGYVVPLSMEVPNVPWIAKQSLEYMKADGPVQDQLPQGFQPLLPAGTEVKGINILEKEKLAIVDFSTEFARYRAEDERKLLEAVTWTLTQFPAIEQVQFWIEGELLKEMPVDGTPLTEPLSRSIGINIERKEGVYFSQASPVTLYFQKQAKDMTYYVPVTRFIERTNNIAMASLEQLISGPLAQTGLASVISPQTVLPTVSQSEDVITVNFDDSVLDANGRIPEETYNSVVLSLAETTGTDKVQILVNGKPQGIGGQGTPVSRPNHINPVGM
jgi:germination protein M